MSSRAVHYRQLRGTKINDTGYFAMVSCARCAKEKLGCKMSSLSKKCGNCESVGASRCEPVEIPLPNFSGINKEMEKLEKQEEDTEAVLEAEEALAEAALERMRAARNKLKRLRRQKRLLQKKEKRLFDGGLADAEDIEQLEALEGLNQEIASANPEAPAVAQTVDWSSFWDLGSLDHPVTTGECVMLSFSFLWVLCP